MSLFDDEPVKPVRSGADWENHRRHRAPQSGPPQDEVGVLALSSFLLARTSEVVVAVRGITAYSDGLHLTVVVLFADEQKSEDLAYSMNNFSRSPGRFRFGCVYADGRAATSGTRDAPTVENASDGPALVLLGSGSIGLLWSGDYWLHPLPPAGPLVLGCRWPDRGIPETLVEIDPAPLLSAAATSAPVWGAPTGKVRL
ncbi:MAG: hypothetical protein JWM62_834 [Frankiales bacterium]|jgi:hypothetical protein|nr:hypothetical protein [Frankiales bacterium]